MASFLRTISSSLRSGLIGKTGELIELAGNRLRIMIVSNLVQPATAFNAARFSSKAEESAAETRRKYNTFAPLLNN